jgi:hypothetical protein
MASTEPGETLYLALVGHPLLPRENQRFFHLFLPDRLVESIDTRVAGARTTAFIVLLQAGLDILKQRSGTAEGPLVVDSDREIHEEGYVLSSDLEADLLHLASLPPVKDLLPLLLRVQKRTMIHSRQDFKLILPKKLANEVEARVQGPRNTAFIILLSIGLSFYRKRSAQKPTVVHVKTFFKTQGYVAE